MRCRSGRWYTSNSIVGNMDSCYRRLTLIGSQCYARSFSILRLEGCVVPEKLDKGGATCLDIFIEEGNDLVHQKAANFDKIIEHFRDYGEYLCRDPYLSYFGRFGGYEKVTTFIDRVVSLLDTIFNAWYFLGPGQFYMVLSNSTGSSNIRA